MSHTHLSAAAVCPFFVRDYINGSRVSVVCEGCYGSTIEIKFRNKKALDAHAKTFCTSLEGCPNCEIYKLNLNKYKEAET